MPENQSKTAELNLMNIILHDSFSKPYSFHLVSSDLEGKMYFVGYGMQLALQI